MFDVPDRRLHMSVECSLRRLKHTVTAFAAAAAVVAASPAAVGVVCLQDERMLFVFTGSSAGQLEVLGWQLLDLPVPKSNTGQTSGNDMIFLW
jgi:hypothetical protein